MNSAIKAGGILAGVVLVVQVLIFAAGLHKNFALMQFGSIGVFLLITIAVLVMALGKTADVNGYGAQLGRSALIGLVGAVAITVGSWALMSFVFPNAIPEMMDGALEFMENAGMTDEQIEDGIAQMEGTTPFSQAIAGGIGTFVSSLIIGAIVSIFRRKKA